MIEERGGFYDRDPRHYDLRVAVLYPSPYLVSVNSLGHQLLYYSLNEIEGVMAERFVLDFKGSVESGRDLNEFDVAVATLHFEGQYPLLLKMIEGFKGQVIVGGPAVTANPIPIMGSVDAVGVGDSEEIIPKVISSMTEGELSSPGLINSRDPSPTELIRAKKLKVLKRQILVTKSGKPLNPFLIEVSRGCNWACKFCLIGWHWHPLQEADPWELKEALYSAKDQGFKEVYVIGSDIMEAKSLKKVLELVRELDMKASVPSLRADLIDEDFLDLLISVGEKRVTVAPETGSSRMKILISKPIDNDDILWLAEAVKDKGFSSMKLYFMVGLPNERDEDVLESAKLASKVNELIKTKVTVSIFVPKAGTPFELEPLARPEVVARRGKIFEKEFRGKINLMHPGRAYLQTVFSVGSWEIANLLKRAYKRPYNKGAYQKEAKKLGINLDSLVYEKREEAPWRDLVLVSPSQRVRREINF